MCRAPQLADLIRQKIDAAFEEHVDMEEVQERFLDVIALALKVVVRSEAQRGCTLATMLTWSLCVAWLGAGAWGRLLSRLATCAHDEDKVGRVCGRR